MGVFPYNFILKHLVDSSGNVNLAGASTTATATFGFTASVPRTRIRRVNVLLVDDAINPTEFGGEAALTNGLAVRLVNSSGEELIDFTDGQSIKRNADWVALAAVDGDPVMSGPGPGDDIFKIRWTLQKAGGDLNMDAGDVFQVIRRDNLVAVTELEIMVQGIVGK